MVEKVIKVDELLNGMANASCEQREGIIQVGTAIGRMNELG